MFNYTNGDQDDFDILAESQSSLLRVIHNLKLTSSAQGQEGLILIYPCLSHAFHTSNTICSDPTLFQNLHIKLPGTHKELDSLVETSDITIVQWWSILENTFPTFSPHSL